MKKLFFAVLAAMALLTSCAEAEKCKCTFEGSILGVEFKKEDQLITRPEDTKCSDIKVEDIKGDVISVDLTNVAKIKCVNYHE